MEQMYLVEIFIDKVTIVVTNEDDKSGVNKSLIIKVKFGPKVQFIIKEQQLALNGDKIEDVVECDEYGKRTFSRTIRVGKSFLFPSYPDTMIMILDKFPLEVEVWNDDENEIEIFVGVGNMHWDTQFFHMLKESAEPCKIHEPLSIKQTIVINAECCCKRAGDVHFIVRLSALGESIITEFQQLMNDPDSFVFRTNKAPSMFKCNRVEGDDPNFCMVGSLYETTTLEDPDIQITGPQKIEICTELQSCGTGTEISGFSCRHAEKEKKKYPIDKIRMGDITGPCGNTNCPLAHKVKNYIRNLDTYKKGDQYKEVSKTDTTRKICGACDCKDDRWHRDDCPEKILQDQDKKATLCSGCNRIAKAGETCEDKKNKMFGTGATPDTSKTQVSYVFNVTKVPDYNDVIRGRNFPSENIVMDCNVTAETKTQAHSTLQVGCSCSKPLPAANTITDYNNNKPNGYKVGTNNQFVYNAEITESHRKTALYNCTEISEEKDCKCNPPKPTPPCKTFDCDCITKNINIAARKTHKPYCPLYKHKTNCPVTMLNEEEGMKKLEDEEDETEPLPYGLPPIQLGPCPVLGRPCTVPDGFARMYKNAVLPLQPPSYDDAGKVCCSKEYDRIKNAIKEYMKYEKDHDFRCVNKFNVDTERRCCDKEQMLLALMGKGCCGSHKLAIQEKFKQDKK